jgi:hypothetical protein
MAIHRPRLIVVVNNETPRAVGVTVPSCASKPALPPTGNAVLDEAVREMTAGTPARVVISRLKGLVAKTEDAIRLIELAIARSERRYPIKQPDPRS